MFHYLVERRHSIFIRAKLNRSTLAWYFINNNSSDDQDAKRQIRSISIIDGSLWSNYTKSRIYEIEHGTKAISYQDPYLIVLQISVLK